MWDSLHIHTHYTIKLKIGALQSPPLKSLTSSLGPTLWGSISESTWGYRTGSNTICNDPKKSASHICTISQKNQSLLRLLAVINKVQIYPINTRCGTHHIPTHITQSIQLGHYTHTTYGIKTILCVFFYAFITDILQYVMHLIFFFNKYFCGFIRKRKRMCSIL